MSVRIAACIRRATRTYIAKSLFSLFVLVIICAWSGIASPFPGNLTETLERRADHKYDSQTPAGDLVCRPFGECEPCPVEEVGNPSLGYTDHSAELIYFARYTNPIATRMVIGD